MDLFDAMGHSKYENTDSGQEEVSDDTEDLNKESKQKRTKKKNSHKAACTSNFEEFPKDSNSSLSLTEETVEKATKIFDINTKMSKYFVVNESVFLDVEPRMLSAEQLHEYELYKVMKEPTHEQEDDQLSEEDLTESFLVTEELSKSGLIINNNVYLTHEQWNTIQRMSEDVFTCALCEFQFDSASVASHIKSLAHIKKLDGHRPLKRFDLSIIRKINENFHCGVCNIVFPVNSYYEHENSKAHEGNLLFAINKVSDLMYSGDNATTQMFNTNNIQAPNNAPSSYRSTGSALDRHVEPNMNAESNSNTESAGEPHRKISDALDTTLPGRNTESAGNTEAYRNTESPRNTDRNGHTSDNIFNSSIITNLHNFNFEKTFNNIMIYEEDEIEEYTLPIEGVSYANMASKPRVDVPKFIKIDLGTKEVRVKFESWNMITQTDHNHYYCMACTITFHVRIKNQHCIEEEHKRLLAKCAVVGAYEDYLIRNVCEKLYHCGHCNNLQYKNDMQIHIEKFHPIKNHKSDPNSPSKLPPRDKPMNNAVIPPKLDIFGDFKFISFNAEINISNLSCHTIMIVGGKYMCALCNVSIQGDLLEHVYNETHAQWINMTPFIRPFRCNLTRAVRGSLHCAICNILVPVSGIQAHNIDSAHTNALARALGMVKNERPKQDIKYKVNEPAEFQKEFNSFISSLPPEMREALSMFKIKNNMGESFQLSDTPSSSSSDNGSTTHNIPLNTSPVHIRMETNIEPVVTTTQDQQNNPQKGAERFNEDPNVFYPGKGVETIKQGSEACYPRKGAEITNPVGYYPGVNLYPAAFHPQSANIDSCYPKTNFQRMVYSNELRLPLLKTDQMLTLSMIESGLPRVCTGSPSVPLRVQTTWPSAAVNFGTRMPVPIPRHYEPVEQNVVKRDLGIVPEKEIKGKLVEKEKVQEKATADSNKPEVRNNSLTDGSDDEEQPFIFDEVILLKSKSSYYKVSSTSYHTLVHLGNGTRHCFVCSSRLEYSSLRRHVASRKHLDNITNNRFLCNFSGPLFRQMYLTYHCAICNVTMSRKEVKMHLEWPTHIGKYNLSCKVINKKKKSGAKEFDVVTQKEFLYEKKPEPPISIVTYVQSSKDEFQEIYVEKVERKLEQKNQMIILKGNMMKISFESWHGVVYTRNGAKCIICQQELPKDGLQQHLETEYHAVALGITFEKLYYPALIRKINENTTNCVICNLELPNDDSLVFEHISGRKHEKNQNSILEKTSHTDSYSDCYTYPITL